MKARPKIRLKAPREVRPGDELLMVVMLECRREVEVEQVRMELEGVEAWSVGAGEHAASTKRTLLRLRAQLSGRCTLPAGSTERPVRVKLPPDAPASVAGASARIEYVVRVHVEIAWWPDARETFELKVVPAPIASPETVVDVLSSNPDGPVEGEPHIELSLASTWVRAGDVVSGAFALANVESNRYTRVTIALRAQLALYDLVRLRGEREHVRYSIAIDASGALEGEAIPFRFALPADAPPEYGRLPRPGGVPGPSALSWSLEIAVSRRWGSTLALQIPFRVLPRSERPGDAPPRLAPRTVGSDRLRAVWVEAGSRYGLTYEAQALRGRIGETALTVRRDHQGRGGVFLVAELAYPELGLELSIERASAMERLVGGDVRVGDAEWDRDHVMRARDGEQSAAFVRALVPALRGAALRRLDDRGLTVELRDAGQSGRKLDAFLAGAATLARELERLRRALPPPTEMRDAVATWRELARTLGATLEPSHMRIEGTLRGQAVEVQLAFEAGRPAGTRLAALPARPLDDAPRFRWDSEQGPAGAAIASCFGGRVGELLAVIAHDADELSVEADRIAIAIAAPLGLGLEIEMVERRLEQLALLARLLSGHRGSYR